MKAYLDRANAYEEFIKKEQEEFDFGKRHLANMMGVDADEMTQDDIDVRLTWKKKRKLELTCVLCDP